MRSDISRRHLAGVLATAALPVLGGCLTTGLSVSTDGVAQSKVFTGVSRTESWATSSTRVDVSLTERATRKLGVSKLVVLTDGSGYDAATLQPHATTATLAMPTTGSVAILATDGSGTVVDRIPVTVTGTRLP
ncbi:hypothetical protein [Haloarchaeobius amylolyticus]|uniref:hypothetical protein n=1 Tax=Haloarchaeobius amylolyticus TaxID=1198296 RepID=UPI0022708576|nr:hypothetical protein [Haloarchaeobius amylolyticus]